MTGQKHSRLTSIGALRDTPCFFLLTAPLFLPPAAGHGEPVNSRSSVVVSGGAGSGTF